MLEKKQIRRFTFFGLFIVVMLSPFTSFRCDFPTFPLPPCAEKPFGVYTERAYYPDKDTPIDEVLEFETAAYIGSFMGNGGIFDGGDFIDDDTQKYEGHYSKKASVYAESTGYAGWFIQWGGVTSSEDETKNMIDYKDGKLVFAVKTPIDLIVGIRSGNIPPGDEKSKFLLSECAGFEANNQWHTISINISEFMARDKEFDISQIKVFFSVASELRSGGTGPEHKTFWIDDIMWLKCPATPYPPNS